MFKSNVLLGKYLKKYQRFIVIGLYGISFILIPIVLGIVLASSHIEMHIVGDFWATLAGIMFLSNVFGFGSERLVTIYAQRFKHLYARSFKINLVHVIKFFLVMFAIIGGVTLLVDLIVYLLLLNKVVLLPKHIHHPILLCFFCIFFFMTARFLGAFLHGEGFQLCVMRYSIYTNFTRIIAVYLVVHYATYFETSIGSEYNLVFTLCLVLSLSELIRIIGYSVQIVRHLRTMPNSETDQLDTSWKKSLWYFGLYSLQYDWLVVITILVEMFGASESEPAIIGYLIGVIRVFYLLSFVTQQLIRVKLAQFSAQQANLIPYLRKISKVFISVLILVFALVLIFAHQLLLHYKIPQLLPQLLILVFIGACKAYGEAILVNFIFTTANKIIRGFVLGSSLIYFGFIGAIITVAPAGINGVLDSFIIFYALIALFELVYGLIALRVIVRTQQNYTLLAA